MLYVIFMIRTQVYLTEEQHRMINQLAVQKKKPAAKVLRDLVDQSLKNQKYPTVKEALMELVKIGKESGATGPTNLSTTIDQELYGD